MALLLLARSSYLINMLNQGLPTYPKTSEMGYAVWLRHFAAKLPAYAYRFELTEVDVAEAKNIAVEFIAWLTHRVGRATQAIRQQYAPSHLPGEEEAAVSSTRLLLLRRAARLVRAIRAHRHYRLADGVDLKLNLAPDSQEFGVLPAPPLYLVGCLALPEKFAVALRWADYPEAIIDLEVCRDSCTWQPLRLLAGECYADIYPQPIGLIQWRYRARYRRPDWPPGAWGDVIKVEIQPLS